MTVFLLLAAGSAQAQVRIIRGRVFSSATREPLAFANILIKGTGTGTKADFDGNFSLKLEDKSDSIVCSFIGYVPQTKFLSDSSFQEINFELMVEVDRSAPTVVVRYKGPNPALRLIKGALEHRDENNQEKLSSYECESFTKVTMAINNLGDKFKRRRMMKQIGPLFDTISYLSEDSNKHVLPIFISETLSDYYFETNGKKHKEYIKATRVKGVGVEDGTFLSQLLGNTFQQYNFYDNTLTILDKNFISPIGNQGLLFYDYRIQEVDKSGPRKIYMIRVRPKNPLDLVFSGYVWIEDSSYALLRLSLEITNKANLNYIEKLKIVQELGKTEAGPRLVVKNRVVVDIAEINENTPGMVAIFASTYDHLEVNKSYPPRFYDLPVSVDPMASRRSDDYWNSNRHQALTPEEIRVMSKIDTLTNLPVVKTYVEIVNIAVEGYKSIGKFDVGPYAFLYGYNNLEGHKVRLGMKTNIRFSDKWILEGYGAYGFSDRKFKYMGQIEHIINRKRWALAGFKWRYDVDQIGVTDNDYGASNLYTAMAVFAANQINRTDERKLWLASDIVSGLRIKTVLHQKHFAFEPIRNYRFAYYPEPGDTSQKLSAFDNTTLMVEFRYAPRDYFLVNDNDRMWITRNGLVMYATYTRGLKNFLNGQFNYHKAQLRLEYGMKWGFMGTTDIILTGTKLFGTLPYPLLNVHRGNQSFVYSFGAYNQMRFFEFVTDQAASLHLEHHFNGALFNRVPLLRRLKIREVLTGKAVYGTISQANLDLIPKWNTSGEQVSMFNRMNKEPYVEIGFGLENIFKILRVDVIQRMTHLDNPNIQRIGVKGTMYVSF